MQAKTWCMASKRRNQRAVNCLFGYRHSADPAIGQLQESRPAGSTVPEDFWLLDSLAFDS